MSEKGHILLVEVVSPMACHPFPQGSGGLADVSSLLTTELTLQEVDHTPRVAGCLVKC